MPSVDKGEKKEIVCKEENFYSTSLLKPGPQIQLFLNPHPDQQRLNGNYMSNLMSQTKLPIELLEEISKEFGFLF